jgi:hypothetical protein
MKHIFMAMFLSAALFAQTKATTAPATKSTVAKTAPKTAPTAAKKTTVGNLLDPSTLKATAPAEFKAKFTTTQGDFVVKVTRAWAPLGADRFYNLVRGGYFNGAADSRRRRKAIEQAGNDHLREAGPSEQPHHAVVH